MQLKLDCLPKNHTSYERIYRINAKFTNGDNFIYLRKEINGSLLRYYVSANNYEFLVSEEFYYEIMKDCKDYYEEDIFKYFYEGETVTISVSKYGIIAEFKDNLQVDFFE